jgi:hypothetical protein
VDLHITMSIMFVQNCRPSKACPICCNVLKLCILPIEYTSVLSVVLIVNSDYFLKRPLLCSSGQRSGFDSRRYQIFWEVVGQERGQLSFVSTTEELLGRKNSGSGIETENTAVWIRCADHATPLCPQKLAPASPWSGGRSVGIIR